VSALKSRGVLHSAFNQAAASTSCPDGAPGIQSMDEIPHPSAGLAVPPANNQLLKYSTNFGPVAQYNLSLLPCSHPQPAQFTASSTFGCDPQAPSTAPSKSTTPQNGFFETSTSNQAGGMADNNHHRPSNPSQHFYQNQYVYSLQDGNNAASISNDYADKRQGRSRGKSTRFEEHDPDIFDGPFLASDDYASLNYNFALQGSADSLQDSSLWETGNNHIQHQRPPPQEHAVPLPNYSQPL
jgi:hypothetical protein